MFERRLKIFLGVLLLFTLVLVLRAAQVQVAEHAEWDRRAADAMKRTDRMDTTRGEILDVRGRRIAVDVPCVDACVDYRALTPQPDARWVTDVARARLRDRLGTAYDQAPRDRRKLLLDEEAGKVRQDIEQMWPRLAKVSARPLAEIEEVRRSIVEKVKMRRRYVWYYNYERAMQDRRDQARGATTQPASVWRKWLLDDSQDAPDVDNFEISVSEETEPHVVLRDVEDDVQVELGKYIDRFPGLLLRPSTHRLYPYGEAGAHVLGRLTKVKREDMRDADPNSGDELRQYEPNDLIGRGGIEALAEQVLRGSRGRVEKVAGKEVAAQNPVRGRDVRASIDIELQHDVQALFKAVVIRTKTNENPEGVPEKVPMHGAAVVIDVPSGEVRALASAPGFDLNRYDEDYARLSDPRDLNRPLLNRATQAQREPGSTVKPMVGLAAAASGVRRPDEGYECTGYMTVNGRYFRQGRCWVNSMFHDALCKPDCRLLPCPLVAHHPVPSDAPKLPGGILKLTDALERSCNPYFESIAHALGPDALSNWFLKFGIGERTYVGIAEAKGRVPTSGGKVDRGPSAMFSTWTAGIGQGPVHATPLQMANVAATIARDGVWVRPKLLAEESFKDVGPTTRAADRVDLGLPPEAVKAVKEGMVRVVNGPAGSGDAVRRPDMVVAGKTGSASAAPTPIKVYDPVTKQLVLEPDGTPKKETLRPSTLAHPNPAAPWYRGTGRDGTDLTHAWFIGFAPADEPQIAFAVLVEYGGSGGAAAAEVAKDVIQLCINHKVLTVPANAPKPPGGGVAAAGAELLRPIPAATQATNEANALRSAW